MVYLVKMLYKLFRRKNKQTLTVDDNVQVKADSIEDGSLHKSPHKELTLLERMRTDEMLFGRDTDFAEEGEKSSQICEWKACAFKYLGEPIEHATRRVSSQEYY